MSTELQIDVKLKSLVGKVSTPLGEVDRVNKRTLLVMVSSEKLRSEPGSDWIHVGFLHTREKNLTWLPTASQLTPEIRDQIAAQVDLEYGGKPSQQFGPPVPPPVDDDEGDEGEA